MIVKILKNIITFVKAKESRLEMGGARLHRIECQNCQPRKYEVW